MSNRRKELGRKGEELAEAFLLAKSYRPVARNFRTRLGEIDLIAWDGSTLVFVEVRTRTGITFGTPTESITWKKRQKLRQLALSYLQTCEAPVAQFRFDVISVMYAGESAQIEHIPHAF
jgi:putative endonuclease